MATKKRTTYEAIVDKFRSMPLTKFDIPEALEAEWLSTAVSDYELNIGCELRYDEETHEFCGELKSIVIRTLGHIMYVS